MPPRLQLLRKGFSTFDLPILPFLAPRVFEPWPSRRCTHRPTGQARQNQSVVAAAVYDEDFLGQHSSQDHVQNLGLSNQQSPQCLRRLKSESTTPLRRRSGAVEQLAASSETLQDRESGLLEGFGSVTAFATVNSLAKPSTIAGMRIPPPIKLPKQTKRHISPRNRRSIARRTTGVHDESQRPRSVMARSGEVQLGRRKHSCDYAVRRIRSSTSRGEIEADSGLDVTRMGKRKKRKLAITSSYRSSQLKERWSELMESLARMRPDMAVIRPPRPPTSSLGMKYFISQSFLDELLQHEPVQYLTEIWTQFPLVARKVLWSELMVFALAHHPQKALQILEVIDMLPIRPTQVSDVLHCIITYHLQTSQGRSQDVAINLTGRICNLLLKRLPDHVPLLTQTSIFILLKNLPFSAVKEFYLTLTKLKQYLSNDTLVQFASRLAKTGETDLAFQILKAIKTSDNGDAQKLLSLCTTMLQKAHHNKNAQYREADIFKYIHESDIIPNIVTYNVLILNAVRGGDHETAWKIHEMMMDTGIETDAFTYSILFNDAKLRVDSSAMEAVMGYVLRRGLTDVYIFTDVLHAIYLMSLESNRTSNSGRSTTPRLVFDRMLQVYCERFHVEPLVRIIPQLSGIISPASDPEIIKDLLEPTHATKVVMVAAYLHCSQADGVKQFYSHFRRLVSSGDPDVKDLMGYAYIYNMIILAFRQHPELRGNASQIIADMLASARPSGEVANVSQDQMIDEDSDVSDSDIDELPCRPHIPPKPDVYTWSTLLHIFMIQGHPRAAEKILAMMIRRGVKPTVVTWNILVSGYTELQDTARTAIAVQRLEAAGFKPNDTTYRILGKLRNAAALSKHLAQKPLVVDGTFMEQLRHEVKISEAEQKMKETACDDVS